MKSHPVWRRNGCHCLLLAVLIFAAAGPLPKAYAALPPGSYQRLQKRACEFIRIKALSVKTKGNAAGTDVTVIARVTGVIRTCNHLHRGAIIRISYTSYGRWAAGYRPHGMILNGLRFVPHRVGPAVAPILKQGASYPAFLVPAPIAGNARFPLYNLAAYGHSFEIL